VLDAAFKFVHKPLRDPDIYYIGQLMDLLSPDFETVVSLEGHLFLPLQAAGRTPTRLYDQLRKEPTFFVDLVGQVDRRARQRPRLETSGVHRPQSSAWSILQGWRVVPGYDDASGQIDAKILRNWVYEVRQGLKEHGVTDLGDAFIGELLSGSPTGGDGVWPAEPVRDLLEDIQSRSMEEGLMAGAMSDRGRTTHGILEGGGQERGLAGLYRKMAAKIDTRWLRTAGVLRRLADNYEEEAHNREETVEGRADMECFWRVSSSRWVAVPPGSGEGDSVVNE